VPKEFRPTEVKEPKIQSIEWYYDFVAIETSSRGANHTRGGICLLDFPPSLDFKTKVLFSIFMEKKERFAPPPP
jgi:hypothetical protein